MEVVFDTDMNMLAHHAATGEKILAFATRSDGYVFALVEIPAIPSLKIERQFRIWAGCKRRWTLKDYRRHTRSYSGTLGRRKQKETRLILDLFESRLKRPLRK